jgi:hypothetical protein
MPLYCISKLSIDLKKLKTRRRWETVDERPTEKSYNSFRNLPKKNIFYTCGQYWCKLRCSDVCQSAKNLENNKQSSPDSYCFLKTRKFGCTNISEINGFGQILDIAFVIVHMHCVTHFICILWCINQKPIFEYFFKYRITFYGDPVICLKFLFYFT